jgi:hypothetical protein
MTSELMEGRRGVGLSREEGRVGVASLRPDAAAKEWRMSNLQEGSDGESSLCQGECLPLLLLLAGQRMTSHNVKRVGRAGHRGHP